MGALRDQTALNIRERAGGRKQEPITSGGENIDTSAVSDILSDKPHGC